MPTTAPSWESLWEQSQEAIRKERFEEALRLLGQVVEAGEGFADEDLRKGDGLFLQGTLLGRLERVDEAEPVLSRALKLRIEAAGMGHPLVAGVLYVMGEMYRNAYRYQEAAQTLTVAAEIMDKLEIKDELAGKIHYSLACITKWTGYVKQSFAHVCQAMTRIPEENPLTPALYGLLASVSVQTGLNSFALGALRKLAETQTDPDQRATTFTSIANLQLGSHNYAEALETAEEALKKHSNSIGLRVAQATALFNLKKFEEALEKLRQALESCRKRDEKAEIHRLIGEVHLHSGHWEQARDELSMALSLLLYDRVCEARIRLSLGNAYLALDQIPMAGKLFLKAAQCIHGLGRHGPRLIVADAHQRLGRLYNLAQQPDRAERRLEKAMAVIDEESSGPAEAMTPENRYDVTRILGAALEELAVCYAQKDMAAEALAAMEEVAKISFYSPLVPAEVLTARFDRLIKLAEMAGDKEKVEQFTELARDLRSGLEMTA